ncbi:MAG: hypothetical protein KDC38_10660 [Planctomycetes bacterium]|nr:hypothetical protein [Planctomycetota bacterium]
MSASILLIALLFSNSATSVPTLNAAPLLSDGLISREDQQDISEEQQRIAQLFRATEIVFKKDGSISLRYDFESKRESLLEDWSVNARKKNVVRWSRGYEGKTTTVEDGLIIADEGMLLHRAKWRDANLNVDYLSTSGTRSQDLLAAIFAYDRGKRIVGSHLGSQCVQLKGLRRTSQCIPRANTTTVSHDERLSFGYKIEKGVLYATKSGASMVNTMENPKFTRDLGPGFGGLAWQGRVQGFVFSVTIEGHLDADWLKEALDKAGL